MHTKDPHSLEWHNSTITKEHGVAKFDADITECQFRFHSTMHGTRGVHGSMLPLCTRVEDECMQHGAPCWMARMPKHVVHMLVPLQEMVTSGDIYRRQSCSSTYSQSNSNLSLSIFKVSAPTIQRDSPSNIEFGCFIYTNFLYIRIESDRGHPQSTIV